MKRKEVRTTVSNQDVRNLSDKLQNILKVAEYVHDGVVTERIPVACADSIAFHNVAEVCELLENCIGLLDELIIK